MEKQRGYSLENDTDTIIIERDLTELDIFVKDFLNIIKEYTDYLVVSGFVSISTGRTRGTEDVDIIFPILDENKFIKLFETIIKKGFWCYQTDNSKEAYSYVKGFHSIRFARINQMFPNIEFIPFNETKKAKFYEYSHPQKIKIDGFEFKIPPIEFEILYKEIVLAGKKDLEDAKHLREFFSDILKKEKFIACGKIIRGELK